MTNPTHTSHSFTPAGVLAAVKRLRLEVEDYFVEQGLIIRNLQVWYNNEIARRSSPTFANGGEPVAYLRFGNAATEDPATREASPLSVGDLREALAHAVEQLPDMPLSEILTFNADTMTVKVATRSFFNEGELQTRPPRKKVEPVVE